MKEFWLLLGLWFGLQFVGTVIGVIVFVWIGAAIARRRMRRLLQSDEAILRRAETVAWPRRPASFWSAMTTETWQGTLYLTDRRLIWRRYMYALLGPDHLDIPFDTIRRCSVGRVWLGSCLEIEAAIPLTVRPYRHGFNMTILRNAVFAQDLANAIDEARGRTASAVSDGGS